VVIISVFHCKQGEYKRLKDAVEKHWRIANVKFSRDEWHLTAIRREFFESLEPERKAKLMTRLAYANSERGER
jgi:predicted transposase YbfD/YdcC